MKNIIIIFSVIIVIGGFGIFLFKFLKRNKKIEKVDNQIQDYTIDILGRLNEIEAKINKQPEETEKLRETSEIDNSKEDKQDMLNNWNDALLKLQQASDNPDMITPDQIRKQILVSNPDIKPIEIDYTINNNFSNTVDGKPKFSTEDQSSIDDLVQRWNMAVMSVAKSKGQLSYDSLFSVMSSKSYLEQQEIDYIKENNWINNTLSQLIIPNQTQPIIVNTELIDKQKISDFMPQWKKSKQSVLGENFDSIILNSSTQRQNTLRNEIIFFMKNQGLLPVDIERLIKKYSIL